MYPHYLSDYRLEEAESLCDSGEPSKAITKLTRAIALQNQNPDLFEKRAEAYILVKNFELAIANFQKALALREEDSVMVERLGVVHCQYGEALYGEGRYSQALMIYEQAAQYRPEDKEVVMKRSVWTVAGGSNVAVHVRGPHGH